MPQARELRLALLDLTNKEDIPVLERVQRGLHAHGLRDFAYAARLEKRVHHFQSMVLRALSSSKRKLPQAAV